MTPLRDTQPPSLSLLSGEHGGVFFVRWFSCGTKSSIPRIAKHFLWNIAKTAEQKYFVYQNNIIHLHFPGRDLLAIFLVC